MWKFNFQKSYLSRSFQNIKLKILKSLNFKKISIQQKFFFFIKCWREMLLNYFFKKRKNFSQVGKTDTSKMSGLIRFYNFICNILNRGILKSNTILFKWTFKLLISLLHLLWTCSNVTRIETHFMGFDGSLALLKEMQCKQKLDFEPADN